MGGRRRVFCALRLRGSKDGLLMHYEYMTIPLEALFLFFEYHW